MELSTKFSVGELDAKWPGSREFSGREIYLRVLTIDEAGNESRPKAVVDVYDGDV